LPRTTWDILDIFVQAPGDLLFFLLVISFCMGSLFLALGNRSRYPYDMATRRYVLSAAALTLLWLLMLAGSVLSLVTALDANRSMPPLERLTFALSLAILAWAFLSADFLRWQRRSNLLLAGAVSSLLLFYLLTANDWLAQPAALADFNSATLSIYWSAIPFTIALASALLVAINSRQIVDAPLKTLLFLLFVLGHGWDMLQLAQGQTAGSYLGGARLAYAGGLLLFPLLIYRLSVALLENSLVEVVLAASQPAAALSSSPMTPLPAADDLLAVPAAWSFSGSRASDERQLLPALDRLLQAQPGDDLPAHIVAILQEELSLDICLLLLVQSEGYADLAAGYDRVSDRKLQDMTLNLRSHPSLSAAAQRGEQTILFPDSHAKELQDFYRRLGINRLSSLYVQPLAMQTKPRGLVLAANPYQASDLPAQQVEHLHDICQVAGRLLDWRSAYRSSGERGAVQSIDSIAAKPIALTLDPSALSGYRRQLQQSLQRLSERSKSLHRQIAQLQQQIVQRQQQIVDSLRSRENSAKSAQQLRAAFDQHSQICDLSERRAQDLLDAEAVLRVLNFASGEPIAHILRETLHKEYTQLVSIRDRLRQHLNALVILGDTADDDKVTAMLESLSDDNAQLQLKQKQQSRRLDALAAQLREMGAGRQFSHLSQLLMQLYAERQTLSQHLAEIKQDRSLLLDEREKLRAQNRQQEQGKPGQQQALQAAHDKLRTERDALREELQAVRDEEALHAQLATLEQDAAADLQKRVATLTEERDNLLGLRDQLKSKLAASSETAQQLEGLQEQVQQLRQQRQELALELSDARLRLAASTENDGNSPAVNGGSAHHRTELVAQILRQLHSPLTAIADYTNLLRTESVGILGAAQLQVLRMLAADTQHVTELLQQLQATAILQPGTTEQWQDDSHVVSILEDILQESSADLRAQSLQVELELEDGLPPVSADATILKHILAQMLHNARRVSPSGTSIKISARSGQLRLPDMPAPVNAVEITMADCGGGIAVEDIPRVFARKYRSDNAAIDGFGDTGVGMSIAQAFARIRQGDLWLTSEMGKGAAFHLALPAQQVKPLEA